MSTADVVNGGRSPGTDRLSDGAGRGKISPADVGCSPGTDRPPATGGGRSRHDGADPAQCRRHGRRETNARVSRASVDAGTARDEE